VNRIFKYSIPKGYYCISGGIEYWIINSNKWLFSRVCKYCQNIERKVYFNFKTFETKYKNNMFYKIIIYKLLTIGNNE